jgi:hypothetical protein
MSSFDEPSTADRHHPWIQPGSELCVVRRQYDRNADLIEFAEQRADFSGVFSIQIAGRFIREQNGRTMDDGPGNAQALLFAP